MQDLLHWVTGWVDWNLALDARGGPNWVRNFVDSPIIVNSTGREFYKQPMYYALAHFSKFLPRGSVRVDSQMAVLGATTLEVGAFKTTQGAIVLIVLNPGTEKQVLTVKDVTRKEKSFQKSIAERSIYTFIWK